MYLIQSPLPLAISAKRAQFVLDQAKKLHERKSSFSNKESTGFTEVMSQIATSADANDILRTQLRIITDIFNN